MKGRTYDLEKAHDLSWNNKAQIQQSKMCGCFSCKSIFPASEAKFSKSGEDETAWCPYCGIDAVIGDAAGIPLTKDFLNKMFIEWFDCPVIYHSPSEYPRWRRRKGLKPRKKPNKWITTLDVRRR